jgi:hypothetical protein
LVSFSFFSLGFNTCLSLIYNVRDDSKNSTIRDDLLVEEVGLLLLRRRSLLGGLLSLSRLGSLGNFGCSLGGSSLSRSSLLGSGLGLKIVRWSENKQVMSCN